MKLYVVIAARKQTNSSPRHAGALGYKHVLLAYGETDIGGVIGACRTFNGVLLDSGAFSMWTLGKCIDLNRYIAFCRVVEPIVDVCANLDVIGDWRGTEANQRCMERAGLHPLPTFHHGSPPDVLRAMVREYDHIGLGGIAKLTRNLRLEWLDRTWPIIRDSPRWPVRVHGWGCTDALVMERYPWYSVDSTTWTVGSWYGSSLVRRGRLPVQLKRADLPGALRVRNDVGTRLRMRGTAKALLSFEEYVTKLWSARGISWEESDGKSETA